MRMRHRLLCLRDDQSGGAQGSDSEEFHRTVIPRDTRLWSPRLRSTPCNEMSECWLLGSLLPSVLIESREKQQTRAVL